MTNIVGGGQVIAPSEAHNAAPAGHFTAGRSHFVRPAAENVVAAVDLIAPAADLILSAENIAPGAAQIVGHGGKKAGSAAGFGLASRQNIRAATEPTPPVKDIASRGRSCNEVKGNPTQGLFHRTPRESAHTRAHCPPTQVQRAGTPRASNPPLVQRLHTLRHFHPTLGHFHPTFAIFRATTRVSDRTRPQNSATLGGCRPTILHGRPTQLHWATTRGA